MSNTEYHRPTMYFSKPEKRKKNETSNEEDKMKNIFQSGFNRSTQ